MLGGQRKKGVGGAKEKKGGAKKRGVHAAQATPLYTLLIKMDHKTGGMGEINITLSIPPYLDTYVRNDFSSLNGHRTEHFTCAHCSEHVFSGFRFSDSEITPYPGPNKGGWDY